MDWKLPTYEYQCKKSGKRFERLQRMSDPPLETCPDCGAPVERVIGAGAGLIFKGSGFYATDYNGSRPECGRERPCCGRDTRCDHKPCDN